MIFRFTIFRFLHGNMLLKGVTVCIHCQYYLPTSEREGGDPHYLGHESELDRMTAFAEVGHCLMIGQCTK